VTAVMADERSHRELDKEPVSEHMISLTLDWIAIFWSATLLLLSCVAGTAIVLAVLAVLPPTFFQDPKPSIAGKVAHPAVHWARLIGKNLLGVLAIAVGLLLALPGVPGPGLPIALVGIMLVSFPGKRRLVQKLLTVSQVLAGINALRARLGRPPFLIA
jgi:hypothetical protein